jgi:hypothetical protein
VFEYDSALVSALSMYERICLHQLSHTFTFTFTDTYIYSVEVIASFTIEIFPNQLQKSDTSPKEFHHTNLIMDSLHLNNVKPPRSAHPPLRQSEVLHEAVRMRCT